MTKKFRINKSLPDDKIDDAKSEMFGNQAEMTASKNNKADKSFTVPLNDYELELLRQYAENEDRSMRYVSRKLLREILELKLK